VDGPGPDLAPAALVCFERLEGLEYYQQLGFEFAAGFPIGPDL
jgi:hypothetical protein